MPFDVGSESFHRRVTVFRLLLERLRDDGVEIAAQRARVGGTRRATHERRLDEPYFVFIGAERTAIRRVGTAAGEQFEQDDAERVDIRGNRDGLPRELLGRGIGGRERSRADHRLLGPRTRVGLQQPRDAEVQQAHVAAFGDEDVVRLQVAMHDQPRVREGDGTQDVQEQRQLVAQAQALGAAVIIRRLAVDEFER